MNEHRVPLPAEPVETESDVLKRYGRVPGQVPETLQRVVDAVKATARQMNREAVAGIGAAEEMLGMLKREQASFEREITRAADTFAARVADYLARTHACARSMVEHRESMLDLGKRIANEPVGSTTNNEEQHRDEE